MKSHIFLTFCLLLTTLFIQLYGVFLSHFSGVDEYKRQHAEMKHKLEVEELKASIAEFKLNSFRQEVSVALAKTELKKDYSLRSLASVTSNQMNDRLEFQKALRVFNRGQKAFNQKEFSVAIKHFENIVYNYSFSSKIIEAQFLLAESYFQDRQLERSIEVIESLVANFPESELTGFALLRLGKIFEIQDRNEEALGIYKTVFQSFSDSRVTSQAKIAMKAVSL